MCIRDSTRAEYEDYYDFKKNFRINAPETFNFAYDVMDVLAEEKPDKTAMIWLGISGEEKRFTFHDFKAVSYTHLTNHREVV